MVGRSCTGALTLALASALALTACGAGASPTPTPAAPGASATPDASAERERCEQGVEAFADGRVPSATAEEIAAVAETIGLAALPGLPTCSGVMDQRGTTLIVWFEQPEVRAELAASLAANDWEQTRWRDMDYTIIPAVEGSYAVSLWPTEAAADMVSEWESIWAGSDVTVLAQELH